MFDFLDKLLGKSSQRPARALALYGQRSDSLDLLVGLDWILERAKRMDFPKAQWVTLNYGGPGDLNYKTYDLASWVKRGRPLPEAPCTSIETGRFLDKSRQGLTDYVWYACLSKKGSTFILCIDLDVYSPSQADIEDLVQEIQNLNHIEYGYSFDMGMEKGPAFYADGGTLNGDKYFARAQLEEIAKWSHAIGESQKLGFPVSDLLRDIYPLNFLNPHHLSMQVKDQSLKDWIESDPKRGSLKPLIEGKLWTWTVPEHRIQPIRKVLGPERLLISWGDFNTPSGGPLGHTYGTKKGDGPPPINGLPLTDDERRWIADGLEKMKPLFTRYSGESPEHFDKLNASRELLFAKLLDIAFAAWSEDGRPDRPSPDEVLHAFAATLGEHLVHRYRMAWYAVEDEYGRSLGVCHRGKGDARTWAHPIDSVAKRIDRGETGFIAGIAQAVGEQIERG